TPAYVKDAFARIRHHLNHDAPETVTDEQVRAFAQDLAVPARPHEDPRTNFEIPAVNEPTLLARLAKITAKAKRLHVAGPVVTRTGEFEKPIVGDDGRPTGMHRTYYRYTITGERPRLADWEFWATIQHEHNDDGTWDNLVNVVPGIDERMPVSYRASGPVCDHCRTTRRRNDTYVLRNVQSGEFKQVGSDCLVDFTGGVTPEQVAFQASCLAEAAGYRGDAEEEEGGGGYGGYRLPDRVDLDRVLDLAAAVIRREGFVSRKTADIEMRQ